MDSAGKCSPVIDRQAVTDTVRLLVGKGNVTELRALEATTAGERRAVALFGYFDDPEQLASKTKVPGTFFKVPDTNGTAGYWVTTYGRVVFGADAHLFR